MSSVQHDEILESLTEDSVEQPTGQSTEQSVEQSVDESTITNESSGQPEEEQIVISIDGEEIVQEEEQARAPEWVRELRKSNREKDKKIRELELKLDVQPGQPVGVVTLPPKPKLEDADYDPEVYEKKLADWFDKKRQHDDQTEANRRSQEEANQQWQDKLVSYSKAKTELKVSDYEDAESHVQDRFTIVQQSILIQGLDNPALVVYALGKNKKKAEELSKITDPVRFAVAVGKLETQLKITTRKSPPPPPKSVTGTGRVSGTVDSALERLRTEAEKTGDYSKVFQHKQQKKRTG